MENTIALKMGVSRTPVREAIRMLSDEGLVLLIPRRGAQVAQISRQELMDVLEIRESLEILATSLACERITEEQKKILEKTAEGFRTSKGRPITEIAEADVAFHEAIYKASGNKRLVSILNNLREQMYRFRLEYLKHGEGIHEDLVREHTQILEAICARNVEKATECIKEHIEKQRETIENALPG
jgi:DNA-binding GntR family transcriptional regulator